MDDEAPEPADSAELAAFAARWNRALKGGGAAEHLASRYSRSWFQTLPTRQRESLLWYQGDGHRQINGVLRGASVAAVTDAPHAAEQIQMLIDAHQTDVDLVVYRGQRMAGTFWERHIAAPEFDIDLWIGEQLADRGFLSTTVDVELARRFAATESDRVDSLVVEIRVPAGTPAVYLGNTTHAFSHQQELLLGNERVYAIADGRLERKPDSPRLILHLTAVILVDDEE